jgi:hypothetical protein
MLPIASNVMPIAKQALNRDLLEGVVLVVLSSVWEWFVGGFKRSERW